MALNDDENNRIYKPGQGLGSSSPSSSGWKPRGLRPSSDWNKPRTNTEAFKTGHSIFNDAVEDVIENADVEIPNIVSTDEAIFQSPPQNVGEAISQFPQIAKHVPDQIIEESEALLEGKISKEEAEQRMHSVLNQWKDEQAGKAPTAAKAVAASVGGGSGGSLVSVVMVVAAMVLFGIVGITALTGLMSKTNTDQISRFEQTATEETIIENVTTNPEGIVMQAEATRNVLASIAPQIDNVESLKITPSEGTKLVERSTNQYNSDVTTIENIPANFSTESFRISMQSAFNNQGARYEDTLETGEDGSIMSIGVSKEGVDARSFISVFKTSDETYRIVIDTLSRPM